MTRPYSDWPHILRIGLGEGGLSILNEPKDNTVFLYQGRNIERARRKIKNYQDAFTILHDLNLTSIGFEFYRFAREREGHSPPEWRSHDISRGWAGRISFDAYSEAANAAIENKQMHIWDICLRVKSQIRICELRLRSLWNVYANISQNNTSPSERDYRCIHSGGWTELATLEVHGLLQDLCTLRDYLCEFASRCVLGDDGLHVKKTASGLIKSLKGDPDKILLIKDLWEPLVDSSTRSFKSLGYYRDLVTHSAPLSHASGLFGMRLMRLLISNTEIPLICIPLPRDIEKIVQDRSRNIPPKSRVQFLEEFNSRDAHVVDREMDALVYLSGQFLRMCYVGDVLLNRSGLERRELILTAKDLAGPIEFIQESPVE